MDLSAQAQDRSPIINLGDAVVSGFSGTFVPPTTRPLAPNKSPLDVTFINPDGPSARIVDTAQPGYVWDGRLWNARKKFDVLARDAGQVFGVAIDDQQFPNIYLTATSAYGLRIVVPDRDGDGLPERVRRGERGATWMTGQFGLQRGGGPGSIWKVDGRTGQVSLFANVTLNGVANSGAALGNITYDTARKQLFVSDLHTGMIHRFDLGGRDLGQFDHGTLGRRAARLPEIRFNPASRIDIANNRFDSENPDTWGLAPPERRVWGLAIHRDRLYYSVWAGSQIWSVGIRPDGSLGADPRWELDVEGGPGALPVTDIVFSNRGAMIFAQRGGFASSYDYSAFTRSLGARVLRYWLEQPDDPRTPSAWIEKPEEYAVGFTSDYRAANGGVDLGYGYDARGRIDLNSCEGSLWVTGENLRNDPALRDRLEPGGPLVVHGIQGSPAGPVREFNAPPWTSYFFDYDDKFDDARAAGHLGVVRVLRAPCTGPVAAYGGPGYPASAPYTTGGECVGPGCPKVCIAPTSLPTSLPPFALPPCTQPGQPVSLVLSTTSAAGVDPNWAVTPFGPQAYHTSYWNWTVLGGTWVQPQQSATAQNHPIGTYVYTRSFNLACRPESYTSLQLSGQFGSDNDAVMTLNGPANIVASCINCYNTSAVAFNHTDPGFFVPGLNTLTVTVTNRPPGGPTGLSLIGKLEAICGPDCVCAGTRPIDLAIGKENSPAGGSGTWFNLWVTNIGAPITFPIGGLTVTDVIPAGMTVTSVVSPNWTCGPPLPPALVGQATLTCTYNLGGSLATGAQLPGSIVVNYTTTGPGPFTNCATIGASPVVGVDTNPANDTACVTVTGTPIDLKIEKSHAYLGLGTFGFWLQVTNVGAAFTAPVGTITVTDTVPLGMNVSSATGPGWSCTTPPPVTGLGTFTCTYVGGPIPIGFVFPPITVVYTKTGPGPWVNCATVGVSPAVGTDTNPANNTSCVTIPGTLIDVAIAKTGGTTPFCPAPHYSFTVTVTNTGIGWPGTGNIVATDTVPANMTFGPIAAPGWTCPLGIIPAGTTFTCTYNGPAPTAGQVLPPITIPATATIGPPFPPYINCASVAITPSSGYLDTNPANDNICTLPVVKPVGCPQGMPPSGNICQLPMVQGPVAGQCICGPGTALVGGECVKSIVCRPPLVPNATGTDCVCSPGLRRLGRECRPPVVCVPPKVLNAARTTCVCGPGLVQRGRDCVRRVECRPPSFSNQAGTACLCPTGFVMQGRECIRVTPRFDPRGIPGIPGFPSGPGRDGPREGPRGGPRGG